jgi:hypothetical protein
VTADRPIPPRRRLEAVITVGADSITELAVHLLQLGTELCTDEGVPEAVDRYTVTDGATGRTVVSVAADVTADSYRLALREWARETLLAHVRADHRAAALDPLEPF